MVAIPRLSPGENAPWEGQYALVREWGEPTGIAIWRNKGDSLPLQVVSDEEPLWYVLTDESNENVQAA